MLAKGDKVVCILNNRASLTIGKEYTIIDISDAQWYRGDKKETWATESWITVASDDDELTEYTNKRFLKLQEWRDIKLKQIQSI